MKVIHLTTVMRLKYQFIKVAKKSIFRDGIDDVLDLVDTELPAYYKKPYINLPFEEMPVS